MAILVTNAVQVARFANALYGIKLGSTTNAAVNADIANIGLSATVNAYYDYSFGSKTSAEVAAIMLGNLGLTGNTAAAAYVEGQLNAAGSAKGVAVLNMLNAFSNLESDATFGAAATAWNATIVSAQAYTASNTADVAATATTTQTFTLTASADTTFASGAGNDTYVSIIGTNGLASNGSTLNAGDVLDGKGGNDKLTIGISGTNTGAVTTSAVTMSNVEEISVSNYQTDDTNDNTINLASVSGVTKIALAASAASGDTAFTNVRGLVSAEMGNGAGDLSLQYVDTVVAGDADTQSLVLAGQTGGEFTVSAVSAGGIETLAITSGTAANTVKVTSSTVKTITVAGSQNLTLTEGATNTLTRVDAAALTGRLTFTTDDTTAINVTGGSANDTITLGSTFTSADTVDGGAGTDTLSVAVAITAASDLAKVTNVEKLTVTGANNVTLAANVAPTTFDFSDSNNNVLTLNTGYTNATTVTLESGDKAVNAANVALTVNMKGADLVQATTITGGTGTDTINLTADSTAALATNFDNVTSVNSIVIVDNGDAASGTTVAGKDVDLNLGSYATSITIDGTALDAGTVTSGVMGADDETLKVDGSSIATTTVALTVNAGAGADTLLGGAGNDVLNGGAGNDSINGAAGNDNVDGGAGDDTINMGGNLTSADTINGGAGNDTLVVTALAASALTNVSNVETLAFTGTASLSSALSFTTIDLSFGTNTDSLTLATGYTGATTVLTDANDVVVNNANVALTVNFNSDDVVTVTGGTGSDSLNITASSSTVATSSKITGVEKITVVDNGDAASGATVAGEDITIDLASYNTALTIDASALDAGTQATNGSDNADYETLTITGTASKKLVVIGGAGADTIVGSSDAAAGDSLVGGGGNDTFTMAGNLSYMDTIDGGAGTDVITTTGAVTDIQFMNVRNVETLTLADTATLSSYFDTSAIARVNVASTKTVDASGTAVGHTYVLSATDADDSVVGGLGNDTFSIAGTVQLKATDAINGGAGTDTIVLNNAAGAVTAVAALTTALVRNVENFTVANANGGDTAGSENADAVSLTFDGSSSSTTAVVTTVDGSVITDTNDIFTVDASGVTDTDFTFKITGGAAADVLKGAAAADTIVGGGGADAITGGAGADNLTGGAGNDNFIFATSDSRNSGADTITDFTSGSDKVTINFSLSGTNFDGTYKGTSASNADALALLSSKEGQYYFNTTTGQMIMDTDGNGLVQSTDFALNLTGLSAITAGDVRFNVTGTNGADTITLGGGADTVTGGAGADTITLGAGADVLVLNQTATADTVADYTVVDDSIQLSKAVYTALGALGALSAAEFESGAGLTAAATAAGRIVYNTTNGALYYDADGSGATAAVLIATLTGAPTLVAGEFAIIA